MYLIYYIYILGFIYIYILVLLTYMISTLMCYVVFLIFNVPHVFVYGSWVLVKLYMKIFGKLCESNSSVTYNWSFFWSLFFLCLFFLNREKKAVPQKSDLEKLPMEETLQESIWENFFLSGVRICIRALI